MWKLDPNGTKGFRTTKSIDSSLVEVGRIVDAVSEGPIVGLVDGLKSVFLDDTPIQNASGSFNFSGVNVVAVSGTNTQAYLPGFPSSESETSINVKVTTSASSTTTITNQSATAARVKIRIPALQHVNSTTGAVNGTSVQIAIKVQNNGGGYVTQSLEGDGVISGRYSSAYIKGFRVALPSPGPWDIRVERITSDSGSAYLQNETWFDSVSTIIDSKLRYPNTACIGLVVDSKQFNSIPRRSFEIKGRIISVPANYDPVARTYATTGTGTSGGIWDGTFKQAWTDNPAWCWYDMATNTRYGGGGFLDASKIDVWGLYAIGQVCDAYVSAGRSKRTTLSVTGSFAADATNSKLTRAAGSWITDGFLAEDEVILSGFTNAANNHRARVVSVSASDLVLSEISLVTEAAASRTVALQDFTEPRFTCNLYLQTRSEAIQLLQDMASVFRGITYWAGGAVVPAQDVDASPAALFTCANVKDGVFTYSGSALKARHTVAVVAWNDPKNGYRQALEYVEDPTGIAKYGINQVQITAMGCTSQGQARRVGAWAILSELNETETVTFTTGLEGIVARPGEVIQIQDQFRAASRMGGRVVAGSTTTVMQLDAPVTLKPGTSYSLSCQLSGGTVETKTVSTGAGVTTALTVSSAFSSAPQDQATWLLSAVGDVQAYRVVGITEKEGNEYEVTALLHNSAKYALIDAQTVTPTNGPPTNTLISPTGVAASSTTKVLKDRVVKQMTVTWTGPTDPLTFIAECSLDYGPWEPMELSGLSAWIEAEPGSYRIRVFSLYPGGISLPTSTTHTVTPAPEMSIATDVASARTRMVEITAAGSGTFNVPADVSFLEVTMQAGGGGGAGGGSSSPKGGSGGGAGGFLKRMIQVTPGAALSYTVGAAGTAGAAGGTPTNGGDGGDTTFNGVTVSGGKGGATNGGASGDGGATKNPLDVTISISGGAGSSTPGTAGGNGTTTSTVDSGVSVSGGGGGCGNAKTDLQFGGRGGVSGDYFGQLGGEGLVATIGGGGGGAASALGGWTSSSTSPVAIGLSYGQGGTGGDSKASPTAGEAGGGGYIRIRW